MKRLNNMDDDSFDEYIREQLRKLERKKGKVDDGSMRIYSFFFQVLTDLKKNQKQKTKV